VEAAGREPGEGGMSFKGMVMGNRVTVPYRGTVNIQYKLRINTLGYY
jgi:hypothetical protein